jgi:hypothetical protein
VTASKVVSLFSRVGDAAYVTAPPYFTPYQ